MCTLVSWACLLQWPAVTCWLPSSDQAGILCEGYNCTGSSPFLFLFLPLSFSTASSFLEWVSLLYVMVYPWDRFLCLTLDVSGDVRKEALLVSQPSPVDFWLFITLAWAVAMWVSHVIQYQVILTEERKKGFAHHSQGDSSWGKWNPSNTWIC